MSGTASNQGVFAVARMPKIYSPESIPVVSGRIIILDNLQDPGNLGTILRTADALGIDGAIVCGGCDVFNPKTVRATMGSLFRIKLCTGYCFNDAAIELKSRGFELLAAVVEEDAEDISRFKFPARSAAVIGNEGNGLSSADAALCDRKITIQMKGGAESLNAATAASIILWELMKGE